MLQWLRRISAMMVAWMFWHLVTATCFYQAVQLSSYERSIDFVTHGTSICSLALRNTRPAPQRVPVGDASDKEKTLANSYKNRIAVIAALSVFLSSCFIHLFELLNRDVPRRDHGG